MRFPEALRAAETIAAKDLLAEFRRPQEILSILTFSLGSLLIAGLALQNSGQGSAGIAAVIWIILFFVVILTFTTSFIREADQGTLGGLKTLPCPPAAILLGKFLAGTLLVLLCVGLIIPAMLLFFRTGTGSSLPALAGVCLAGAAGLALAGAFVSSLVIFSEGKTLLASLLLIPVCIPDIVLAVLATDAILGGAEISVIYPYVRLMVAFILLLAVIILLTFSVVLEE